MKVARQDADDNKNLVIDRYIPADRCFAAAEAPLPEAVRKDGHPVVPLLILVTAEIAAQKRLYSQQREQGSKTPSPCESESAPRCRSTFG